MNLGDWQSAYDKASTLIASLTNAAKLSVITGEDVSSFPALHMLNSSTNLYNYYYVTTWPAGLAMAMTWNTTGIHAQGEALHYSPLQPLGRSAWGGRQERLMARTPT